MLVSRRILVVDDHADTAETFCAVLRDLGHDCRWTTDPNAGMALARELVPEIAFLDLHMPELDGYQLARLLRAQFGAGLYLVALTAYGSPEHRRLSREAGFDAHVRKPADMDMVNSILDTLFAAQRPLTGSRRQAE